MRKLTKAHFTFLAKQINNLFLAFEKVHMEDVDNKLKVSNFSEVMYHARHVKKHQTPAVAAHIDYILDNLQHAVKDKEYQHFNHSFNCFMKRLCVELKKQNPKFVESKFREACTKGSIQ
ncbi:hypothetical protein vBValCWD615_26 [Vibrio phage vB_ValC_WD615]|nr:hypothetical protein vBValCWD615_26 [Vibrio phage vB_ValC_WD615]